MVPQAPRAKPRRARARSGSRGTHARPDGMRIVRARRCAGAGPTKKPRNARLFCLNVVAGRDFKRPSIVLILLKMYPLDIARYPHPYPHVMLAVE